MGDDNERLDLGNTSRVEDDGYGQHASLQTTDDVSDGCRYRLCTLGGVQDDVFLDLSQELLRIAAYAVMLLEAINLWSSQLGHLRLDGLVDDAGFHINDVGFVSNLCSHKAVHRSQIQLVTAGQVSQFALLALGQVRPRRYGETSRYFFVLLLRGEDGDFAFAGRFFGTPYFFAHSLANFGFWLNRYPCWAFDLNGICGLLRCATRGNLGSNFVGQRFVVDASGVTLENFQVFNRQFGQVTTSVVPALAGFGHIRGSLRHRRFGFCLDGLQDGCNLRLHALDLIACILSSFGLPLLVELFR